MRFQEFKNTEPQFLQALQDFLPIAMQELGLKSLPKIKLEKIVPDDEQPTFGRMDYDVKTITIGLANRHVIDILRTLAHELVHWKQLTLNQLGDMSGETGSPEENQANEVAGVIMRHFNKKFPQYFHTKPLDMDVSK
jgi:hypothetical protein